MKKIRHLKDTAFTLLNKLTMVINQLPDPNAKVRQMPLFRQQFLMPAMAKRTPIDRSPIHNHPRDRKRKGPRHSSTVTYNHPRGDIRRG